MKIKICGLKYKENIMQLSSLKVDLFGFIFYDHSIRNAADELDSEVLINLPKKIKKVAVFVDSTLDTIERIQLQYKFDFIQLHGSESSEFCREVLKLKAKIIKVFLIDDSFDFSQLKVYQPYCSYFLFDTKGKNKGGNGIAFNWNLLEKYTLDTPFFLSGGIGLQNIQNALQLKHPQFKGVDVNSKVEKAPAKKSVEKIKELIKRIKER